VRRKRGSSPKLLLWNNGLISALSTKGFSEALADTIWWGRLVENAVGAHLCNMLSPVTHNVTYWRDGRDEVDFVVASGAKVWAIEVKSGRSGKGSGLERFRARYPGAEALLVGAQGIPLEEFFTTPIEAWLT
jgi:predicted AAA+ superfamily ATPase